MNLYLDLKNNLTIIEKKINYFFNKKELLILSFVHRSFVNENKGIIDNHNERLEFLGDSVLNLIVGQYLYEKYPEAKEGKLSFLRSQIVDSDSCKKFVETLDIEKYLLLGKGEILSFERSRANILADFFEALIGAIFIDGGYETVKNFFLSSFKTLLADFSENPEKNYKAEFQTYCQKKYLSYPEYRIIKEYGPDHAKIFEVETFVGDIIFAVGKGASKKEAEMNAAKNALEKKNN